MIGHIIQTHFISFFSSSFQGHAMVINACKPGLRKGLGHEIQRHPLTTSQITYGDASFQPLYQSAVIHLGQKLLHQYLAVLGVGQLCHKRLKPGIA